MLWLMVVSKPLVEIRPPPLPIEIMRVDARLKFVPNTSVPRLCRVRPLVTAPRAASLVIVKVADARDGGAAAEGVGAGKRQAGTADGGVDDQVAGAAQGAGIGPPMAWVIVSVPAPRVMAPPVPDRFPMETLLPLRSKVPPFTVSRLFVDKPPPLPICKVPALTVVPPV